MILFFQTHAEAQTDLPQHFTLDGRLFEPGSSSEPLLDSSTVVTIQVLNPAKDCVLYEEEQAVNTLGTNGYFSLRVGSPTGDPKRTGLDRNNSMTNVFYNRITPINGKTQASANCTYTPAAGEERYFRFFIKPSTASTAVQLSDDMPITSVPQALVAQTLQGLGPSDVFRTSVTSTQAKLDNLLTTQYSDITDLASGTSTQYLRNDPAGTVLPSRNTNPSSPTEGQIWFDNATNELKYFNGATVETVSNGSGVTSITAGQGLDGGTINSTGTIDLADSGVTTVKLDDEAVTTAKIADTAVTTAKIADSAVTTAKVNDGSITDAKLATGIDASKITVNTLPASVVPTGTDDTKLPLVGGTMTGPLVLGDDTTFSGFDLLGTGHITMSPQKTITIGRYDSTEQPTLIATLGPLNAGAMWFNSSTGKLMYWSGTAAFELSESTSAGGDITAVNTNAGSGLSGGNTSGPITLQVVVDGTTIEIATNTIQLKALGVASGHLQDGSVLTAKLVDDAVTTAKIDDEAVTTAKLDDEAVTTAKLADSSVSTSKLVDTSVTEVKLANSAVTSAKLADDSVITAKLDDSAVTTVKIDDEAVTTAKLADSSVSTSKLVDTSVTEVKLADGAVTSAKIADGTITSADIDTITIGKISSAASEYFTYMPNGTECTDGYVLKWTSSNRWECASDLVGATDHGALTGLGDDDHTQYALLAGRGAGQNLRGGTAASANLTLESTSDVTKGYVILQPTAGNVGIGTATPNAKLEVSGALRLSSTTTDTFVTPQGSNVPTKINIPTYDPGNFGQVMAMGVPSTANTNARVLSLIDARTGAHQPTLSVFSPNESEIVGLSFNGSNTVGAVESTTQLALRADGNIALEPAAGSSVLADKIVMNAGDFGSILNIQTTSRVAAGVGMTVKGELGGDNRSSVLIDVDETSNVRYPLRVTSNTGATEVLAATAAGNVGIGSADPQARLDVAGRINAQEICDETGSNCRDISTGWGGSGDVMSARAINTNTGSALTGGGDLSADRNIAVNVDNSGIEINSNALRLKDGGVTSAKIADGTIVSADVDAISIGKISNAPAEYFTYMPAGTECTDGFVLKWTSNDRWECAADLVGATDHGALTGLGDDDHTQYALLAGRGAGQNLRGGTAASGNLTLESTSDTTKGHVLIQPNGGGVGIGTTGPVATAALQVDSTTKGFLPPRMTSAQRVAISSPANGLVVFDTDEKSLFMYANSTWASLQSTDNLAYIYADSTSGMSWTATTWTDVHNVITLTTRRSKDIARTNSTLTFTRGGLYYVDFKANGWGNERYLGFRLRKTNGTAATLIQSTVFSSVHGAAGQQDGRLSGIFTVAANDVVDVEYATGNGTASSWGSNTLDGESTVTAALSIHSISASISGSVAADHLGNHTATQNLILGSNWLTGDGDPEGIAIGATGNVGIGTPSPNSLLDVAGIIRAEQICDEAGLNCKDISTGWNTGNVASTRAINTNTGSALTGGGDLSADRNIAVNVDNTGIEINSNALRLKDGGVSSAKITDGTIVSADVDTISIGKISNAPAEYFTYMPAGTECTDGFVLKWTSNDRWECAADNSVTDHGALTGLSDDDHTQYAMLAGRGSGQLLRGGTAASGNLTLESTSDATKGHVLIQPNGGGVGIGTTSPLASAALQVNSTTKGFLPPRMTQAQRDAISPTAAGMMVYNTDTGNVDYHNGSKWLGLKGEVKYIKLGMSTPQSVNSASIVAFDTIYSNSGFTTTSNGVNLKAGVTYRIEATVNTLNATGAAYLGYHLWNGTSGIGQNAYTSTSGTSAIYGFKSQLLEFYTPSADETIWVRISDDNIGTGTATPFYNTHFVVTEMVAPGTSGGGSDNLGNHTAAQNISLGNNWISGDGGAEGIRVDSNGNVGIGSATPNALLDIAGIIRAEQICDEAGLNCKDISTGWNTGNVSSTRAINTNTGSGLTGGGDLSADRSIAMNVDNSTIEIATNTVQVKDGGITSAKITDGTIVSADVDAISIGKISNAPAEYFTYMPAGTECTDGFVLKWTSSDRWECSSDLVGATDHGALTGLGDDDHTQYALLAGRGSGQNLRGGTTASANLTLESTSDSTKGYVLLQPTGGSVGIGTTAPLASAALQVNSTSKGFLPPRMTTAERAAIASPAEGLIVFDTTEKFLFVYRDSAWAKMADVTEVGFRATASSAQSIPHAVFTKLDFSAENFDTHSYFNLTSDRFTPLKAGYYHVTGSVLYTPNAGWNNPYIVIYKNGSGYQYNLIGGNHGEYGSANVSTTVYMNGTTDYLELFTYQASGTAYNTYNGGGYTHFEAFLISGGTGGSGGGGSADDMGNHIATTNISLTNHWISNDGGAEGIRIDNNGNVGIGTATAGQLLTVNGTIESLSGGIKFPDGTVQTTSATSGSNNSMLSGWPDAIKCKQADGTELILYLNWGPHFGLVIYRDPFSGPGGDRYHQYNYPLGTYNAGGGVTNDAIAGCDRAISTIVSDGRGFNFAKGPAAQWLEAGGNAYRNVGSVGIGTSTPANKLHILNPSSLMDTPTDASLYGLRIQGVGPNGSTSSGITFGETTTVGASIVAYDGGSGGAQGFRFYTQNTSSAQVLAMSMTESGNVGVGTAIPLSRLNVHGPSGVPTLSTLNTNNPSNSLFRIQTEGNNGLSVGVYGITANYATWLQSSFMGGSPAVAYNMLLNPMGGNVGIGVDAPTEKLEVNGKIKSTNARSFASVGAVTTTTSGTWADISGMSVTVTTGNLPVMISAVIPTYNNTASAIATFRIVIDGVAKLDQTLQYTGSNDVKNAHLQYMETLSAGSHTIKVQWATNSGTLTASWGSAPRTLMVWE